MKLQSTYKGQSAGQILKTAEIATMQAGNVEITVAVDGRTAHARLGKRTDVWGCIHSDVLVIDTLDGMFVRLECGPRALAKLGRLTAEVDAVRAI